MKYVPIPDKPLDLISDQRVYIRELVDACLEVLKLSGYTANIYFPGDTDFDDAKEVECYAQVSTNYPYREFDLSIQQPMVDKMTRSLLAQDHEWREIERMILHECAHVLVAPLSNTTKSRFVTEKEVENQDENLVDHITMIVTSCLAVSRKRVEISQEALSTRNPQNTP